MPTYSPDRSCTVVTRRFSAPRTGKHPWKTSRNHGLSSPDPMEQNKSKLLEQSHLEIIFNMPVDGDGTRADERHPWGRSGSFLGA